jgi:predicted DNA-binding ribbon-helix-helix protein
VTTYGSIGCELVERVTGKITGQAIRPAGRDRAGGEGEAMIRRPGLGSLVLKRAVMIDQHETSSSLEASFLDGLKEIAAQEGISIPALITRIDTDRQRANLSSAVRLYVLDHYRRLAEQALAAKGSAKR